MNIRRVTTLQYMGSKNRILENICEPIISDKQISSVIDLFAGTGTVGFALAPYKNVISNDIEYYSYVLNEALLNGCYITESEYKKIIKAAHQNYEKMALYLSDALEEEKKYFALTNKNYEEYANFSEQTPSVFTPGTNIAALNKLEKLVEKVHPGGNNSELPFDCLFVSYYANAYFGINQCCEIDSLVSVILSLKDQRQKNVLLAALMSALSSTASTTTHFAQYLKVKSPKSFDNIITKRKASVFDLFNKEVNEFRKNDLLNKKESYFKCYNLDYEDCLKRAQMNDTTLVYADPPYFKEHYSRYYHILNTLCLYDYPKLAFNKQTKKLSIGRYRADRNVSDFGKKAKALSAFEKLINYCADKKAKLMISYSENSIVKIEDIIKAAHNRYFVNVEKIPLKHSSQGRSSQKNQVVQEYLIFCTLPDNKDLWIENTANKIKKIRPVVDNPAGLMHNYMARKPYTITSELIKDFTSENDVVYDPMFGSGTTLIEASKLGRKSIGTDINPIGKMICSNSLTKWDISKIKVITASFLKKVKKSSEWMYTFNYQGEERIIERCFFDNDGSKLMPTSYWYQINVDGKLTGRKKAIADSGFIENYSRFCNKQILNIKNHLLIPNSRIAIKENERVFDLFCRRNLCALDNIFGILKSYEGTYGYEILQMIVSSSINLIRLSDKKASSQMPYWIPKKNATSRNAIFVLEKKTNAVLNGLEYLEENCKYFTNNRGVKIYNCPAQWINENELPDESIDLVLTDPPYTDQVPYLEYNQLDYELFGINEKVDYSDELVVSNAPSRNKDQNDFDKTFELIVKRTQKALKWNGIFILFYHTFDLKSWNQILMLMENNNLRYVYQIPTPSPRKSFKTVMSPRSTLNGNYLLFFIKDKNKQHADLIDSMDEAINLATKCAENIIISRKMVTTQDLYDNGLLKDSFDKGYLQILSTKYNTFADVIIDSFNYEDGYWRMK